MSLFFAYDAYLNIDLLKKYCRNARQVAIARMLDHSLTFIRVSGGKKGQFTGYMAIMAKPGDTVWGVLYRLEQDDLRFLDRYEKVPDEFHRDTVDVITDNGSNISAYALLVNRDSPPGKSAEQFRIAIQGAEKQGLPDNYIARLEQMYRELSGDN